MVNKPPTIPVPVDTFEQLVDKATKYDAFKEAGYETVEDVNRLIEERDKEIDELKRKNAQLQIELTACETNTPVPPIEPPTEPTEPPGPPPVPPWYKNFIHWLSDIFSK